MLRKLLVSKSEGILNEIPFKFRDILEIEHQIEICMEQQMNSNSMELEFNSLNSRFDQKLAEEFEEIEKISLLNEISRKLNEILKSPSLSVSSIEKAKIQKCITSWSSCENNEKWVMLHAFLLSLNTIHFPEISQSTINNSLEKKFSFSQFPEGAFSGLSTRNVLMSTRLKELGDELSSSLRLLPAIKIDEKILSLLSEENSNFVDNKQAAFFGGNPLIDFSMNSQKRTTQDDSFLYQHKIIKKESEEREPSESDDNPFLQYN